MNYPLLPQEGRFYKVNLHCHTTLSDGKQTPEEVKAHFKANGYSAVCFTDHEVLIPQKELCDKDFIALHGYEVAIKKDLHQKTGLFMPVYHFNLIAKDPNNLVMPMFFFDNPSFPGDSKLWRDKVGQYEDTVDEVKYDVDWINHYIKTLSERGFLVTYNHPMWSLQTRDDYIGLKGLHAIEIINGGCAGHNDNTSIHFEQMLRAGTNVIPVGGDDNHDLGSCCLGWTMIKAKELTYEALMDAYEKGDCYASEGPEILDLAILDGKITIKTSEAVSIRLFSEGRYCVGNSGEKITEASFAYTPEKFGRYFRIEVKDASGKRAFSRAYFTADLPIEA